MAGKHHRSAASRRRVDAYALGTAGAVGVSVLGVGLVIHSLTAREDTTLTTSTAVTSPAASTPSPSTPSPSPPSASPPSASPPSASPPSPPATTPSARSITLDLVVTGPASYLTIRVPGGATLFTGLAAKGRHLAYDRPRLEVVLGSAGSVRVLVNGDRVRTAPAGTRQILAVAKAPGQ